MARNTTTEFSAGRRGLQPRVLISPAARPEQDQPRVYIVLLNWNGWQDTLECMDSLRRMEYQNWHAVIVDNGSTDDSVARLKDACPDVTVIGSPKNLGFAAGNNVGIRLALNNGADYVFVLNNDTTVFPDTITEFVKCGEMYPEAALMGPSIGRRNPQREWPVSRKMDLLTVLCAFTPLRRLITRVPVMRRMFYCIDNQPSVVQFLSGSALFFRAAAIEKAGLFDENTFLDFEELIIAEKVRQSGFCAYFIPQARIWHKGSASAVKLRARRYIENAKSEEYFLSRYVRLSPFGRSVVRLIRFLTYVTRALLYRNYRENFFEFMNALRHTTSYS
jgi:GT2 family glycosyltransferase